MRDLCPPWHDKEEMRNPSIFLSVAKFFHSGKDLPVSSLSFASAFPASAGFNIDGLKYVRKAVFFEQPKISVLLQLVVGTFNSWTVRELRMIRGRVSSTLRAGNPESGSGLIPIYFFVVERRFATDPRLPRCCIEMHKVCHPQSTRDPKDKKSVALLPHHRAYVSVPPRFIL